MYCDTRSSDEQDSVEFGVQQRHIPLGQGQQGGLELLAQFLKYGLFRLHQWENDLTAQLQPLFRQKNLLILLIPRNRLQRNKPLVCQLFQRGVNRLRRNMPGSAELPLYAFRSSAEWQEPRKAYRGAEIAYIFSGQNNLAGKLDCPAA